MWPGGTYFDLHILYICVSLSATYKYFTYNWIDLICSGEFEII